MKTIGVLLSLALLSLIYGCGGGGGGSGSTQTPATEPAAVVVETCRGLCVVVEATSNEN